MWFFLTLQWTSTFLCLLRVCFFLLLLLLSELSTTWENIINRKRNTDKLNSQFAIKVNLLSNKYPPLSSISFLQLKMLQKLRLPLHLKGFYAVAYVPSVPHSCPCNYTMIFFLFLCCWSAILIDLEKLKSPVFVSLLPDKNSSGCCLNPPT